jgi:hypothetical protein
MKENASLEFDLLLLLWTTISMDLVTFRSEALGDGDECVIDESFLLC